MAFPVTINGNTYAASSFSSYEYVTNFPAIMSDLATVAANIAATAAAGAIMVSPLQAVAGTFSAPGLTFGGDTDTGWYRIGANNFGGACNGAKVIDIGTAGVGVVGTVSITPAAGSLAQGLVTNQSGPASGEGNGPFFFNHTSASFRSTLTGSGDPGAPGSSTVATQQFNLNVGGANYNVSGTAFVLSAGLIHDQNDTATGDKTAFSSGVYSTASSPGKIYGGAASYTIASGGSTPLACGFEVDTFIIGTGSADYRIGINSWNGGTKNGNLLDSAYTIGNSGAFGVAKWKKGLTLFTQGGATNNPMADDADLFYCDHATTIANIFAFSTVDVARNILDFPHVKLSGAGALALDSTLSATGLVRTVNSDFVAGVTGSFVDVSLTASSGNTTGKIQVFNDGGLGAGALKLNPLSGDVELGSTSSTTSVKGTLDVASGKTYTLAGTQVVAARVTGYAAMSGSPDKATAYATGSVTLAQLAGRVAQLQADLTTHGLIGA